MAAPPPITNGDSQAAELTLQELIDRHHDWAWGDRDNNKHSLAMRSDAIVKNIGLRIDLLKAEKAAGGGAVVDIAEVLGLARDEGGGRE